MHVVLLSHEYPPFVFGGVGTFVKDLAKGLARRGTRVTILSGYPIQLTSKSGSYYEQECKDGVMVVRLPYPQIPPRHLMFQLLNLKKLSHIVGQFDPDIIHGQSGSTFPALLTIRQFAPVIVTFHSSPRLQMTSSLLSLSRGGTANDFFTYNLGYPLWRYTFRKEFQKSTTCVAVSETLVKQLTSEIDGKSKKFVCIKNGVDLEMLDAASIASQDCEEEEPKIVFGGRLFWNKGVFDLLKLAYLLRKKSSINFRIVIYGYGPLYESILREKQRFGLTNVILNPFATRTEFLKSMMQASFVAMTSLHEACPMVLLEGMCMGKIPILFDVPFAREFTQEGKYGILAKNVQDMAARVESLHTSGHLGTLQKEIRSFSRRNYDINLTASNYELLYKQLTS